MTTAKWLMVIACLLSWCAGWLFGHRAGHKAGRFYILARVPTSLEKQRAFHQFARGEITSAELAERIGHLSGE